MTPWPVGLSFPGTGSLSLSLLRIEGTTVCKEWQERKSEQYFIPAWRLQTKAAEGQSQLFPMKYLVIILHSWSFIPITSIETVNVKCIFHCIIKYKYYNKLILDSHLTSTSRFHYIVILLCLSLSQVLYISQVEMIFSRSEVNQTPYFITIFFSLYFQVVSNEPGTKPEKVAGKIKGFFRKYFLEGKCFFFLCWFNVIQANYFDFANPGFILHPWSKELAEFFLTFSPIFDCFVPTVSQNIHIVCQVYLISIID